MLRRCQGIEDRSIITSSRDKNPGAFTFYQCNSILVHTAGDVDFSLESEAGSHTGHGPAMIAVSRGINGEARGRKRFADRIERRVEREVKAFRDGAKRAPRGSEYLERRQTTAAGFVFQVDGTNTGLASEFWEAHKAGRLILGEATVEPSDVAADFPVGRGDPIARIRVEVEVSAAGWHLAGEARGGAWLVAERGRCSSRGVAGRIQKKALGRIGVAAMAREGRS